MSNREQFENLRQFQLFCLSSLTAVALAAAFIYTRPVLLPFIFAVFAYFASVPLLNFLEKRLKLPSAAALSLTFLFSIAIITMIVMQLLISISNIIADADIYEAAFLNLMTMLNDLLIFYGLTLSRESLTEIASSLPLASYARDAAANTFSFLANAFLITVIYFFLMVGRSKNQIKKPMLLQIEKKVSSYVLNKVLLSLGTALCIYAILAGFGLRMAFLFSALAFLLNFIPSIGSIVATLLPIPIMMIEFGFGMHFWFILILTAAIQLIIGNIIDPKIIGRDLDLHPIAILLSLIFWGILWGAPGVFVAVPMTAGIKLVFAKFEATQSYSEILAGRL